MSPHAPLGSEEHCADLTAACSFPGSRRAKGQILPLGRWPVLTPWGRTQQAKPRKANLPVYCNFSSSQRGGRGRGGRGRGGGGRGGALSLSPHAEKPARSKWRERQRYLLCVKKGLAVSWEPAPEQTRSWQKLPPPDPEALGASESAGGGGHPRPRTPWPCGLGGHGNRRAGPADADQPAPRCPPLGPAAGPGCCGLRCPRITPDPAPGLCEGRSRVSLPAGPCGPSTMPAPRVSPSLGKTSAYWMTVKTVISKTTL